MWWAQEPCVDWARSECARAGHVAYNFSIYHLLAHMFGSDEKKPEKEFSQHQYSCFYNSYMYRCVSLCIIMCIIEIGFNDGMIKCLLFTVIHQFSSRIPTAGLGAAQPPEGRDIPDSAGHCRCYSRIPESTAESYAGFSNRHLV